MGGLLGLGGATSRVGGGRDYLREAELRVAVHHPSPRLVRERGARSRRWLFLLHGRPAPDKPRLKTHRCQARARLRCTRNRYATAKVRPPPTSRSSFPRPPPRARESAIAPGAPSPFTTNQANLKGMLSAISRKHFIQNYKNAKKVEVTGIIC